MNDLFESELWLWRKIEYTIRTIFALYGYDEIRTPILEELALFKRSIGEATDIVEKEMFLVPDGEHNYCMRPENTAAVVRALIERGDLSHDSEEKLYYIGPMFRKERPQKGRLRQFHQFGIEAFGISDASADIEIIVMINHLFESLGLDDLELRINSLGLPDERAGFKLLLKDYLSNFKSQLCEDCQRRLETNTLRVLDCKKPGCKEIAAQAPHILDALSEDSRVHFNQVIQGLAAQNVAYKIDHSLVRGLDYYNRTVFEFVATSGLGAQNAVAAGGRYDGLFQTLGNKFDMPAIGCAGGIERMVMLLQEKNLERLNQEVALSLVAADGAGQERVFALGYALRKLGVAADFCLSKKSVKAQMRRANRLKSRFVIVIGENEILKNHVIIKSLERDFSQELELDAQKLALFINRKD
jgi:histidyl-tRNA synthetase